MVVEVILLLKTDGSRSRAFRLTGQTAVIGRDHRCDVRVPLPSVAMRHCQISRDGDEIRVERLDPDAVMLHNGAEVDAARLGHGDRLGVGLVEFHVQMPGRNEHARNEAARFEVKPPRMDTLSARPDGVRQDPIGDEAGSI